MRPNGFSQAACYTLAQNSADSTTSIAVSIGGKLYLPLAHPQSLTCFWTTPFSPYILPSW